MICGQGYSCAYCPAVALLAIQNVSLHFGGLPLLDGVTLNIERGDRICLLGANGAGKSSLLRVLAGDVPPDGGEVVRASGVRIARLPQQVPSHLQGRVLDIVHPGHAHDTEAVLLLEAEQIIDRLGLDPAADFATLSGGTRRRVLLARALLGSPDVVLLDEPTNHLDVDSIVWLETFLLRYCRTFLFVTHDRAFLRRLATRIVELDRGSLRDWTCDYDTFLRRKEEALAAEEKRWQAQDKKLAQEEAWLRRGVKARRTRNEGRVRDLLKLRAERAERRERAGTVQMSIQEAERTGRIVLQARNLTFGFVPDRPLIRDLTTTLTRGDRIGILGPNGCGKTTLLRLLLEPEKPSAALRPQSGSVRHGANLQIAYADQLRAALDDTQTLVASIAKGQEFVSIQGNRRHVIGYLQDFLFSPERARQPVGSLSGGERNRLLLACLFAQPSNVLVLDEPTNDLDLDTLELLEEQIAAYNGTVLVVSHDRAFLNQVVTSTLVFEQARPDAPDRRLGPDEGWFVNEYAGGYDDWEKRRVQPPAAAPAPAKQPAPPAAKPKSRKKWLTDRERREIEALPGHIEALEAEQANWIARLADPAFYRQSDSGEIARGKRRVEELPAELEQAYTRWTELEALNAAYPRGFTA
jgi:ATP-binding cassette subfamily F protein uup